MKKYLLIGLLFTSHAVLACDIMSVVNGKLQKSNTVGQWLSKSPSDICQLYNPQNADINVMIYAYAQNTITNAPANGISVQCNGQIYSVSAGEFFVCPTKGDVSWFNIADNGQIANGETGLSK